MVAQDVTGINVEVETRLGVAVARVLDPPMDSRGDAAIGAGAHREVLPEPFSEYVHGTFFYDRSGEFVLVQVLNTLELATEGEYRGIERVRIRVDRKRLNVRGAQVVWPEKRDLAVSDADGRKSIVLSILLATP